MDRPTFFLKRSDRLVARLKHLFYGWRFADQVDGKVVVMWPPNSAFSKQFDGPDFSPSLIFNLRDFYAQGGSERLVFLEGALGYPAERQSLRDAEFDSMRPNMFDRAEFEGINRVFYEEHAATFTFSDEPRGAEHIRQGLKRLYTELPHEPVTARNIQTWKDRIGSEYVGLHVRRGDVWEMLRNELPKLATGELAKARLELLMGHYVGRTAINSFYFDAVDQAIRSGRKIVFFSDSPSTINEFIAHFGRRHFIDGERFKARYPIQKAFLDFNLLIGASQIISTTSNYATFASMLGRGNAVNVCATGPFEDLVTHLQKTFLQDVSLPVSGLKMLETSLREQYDLRSPAKGKVGSEQQLM